MNRRELIKKLACTGAAYSMLSTSLGARAQAVASEHNWVFITAFGGWDVSSQWDPKGFGVNRYPRENIRTAGNLRYAPVSDGIATADQLNTFTQKHYKKMRVINGINQGTNNHDVGRRIAMVGSDARGLPVMGAFLAAPYSGRQSMPFIVAGGFSDTAGLLSESRLLSRDGYNQLLYPDRFMDSDEVHALLNQRKQGQLDTMLASAKTQADIRALTKLATARRGSGGVAELLERIPGELNGDPQYAAVEMAAAGFAAGAATSLSVSVGGFNGMGGFDTHRDNDGGQWFWMDQLLPLVDHLIDHLTIQDVLHKTTIIINSDFGRRPYYNNNNGKDHWPVTSMVAMGAGIEGNTVIGGTDDFLNSRRFDPVTLEEDENGIHFNPSSIYASLRRLAKMDGTALDLRFPLSAEYMAVFD